MSKTITDRHRRTPAVISAIVIVMACCVIPLALLAFVFINQPKPYPNSKLDTQCSDFSRLLPRLMYEPTFKTLIIRFAKFECFYTSDRLATVVNWYNNQGWPMNVTASTSAASGDVKFYGDGFIRFSILQSVSIQEISVQQKTSISITVLFDIIINGP